MFSMHNSKKDLKKAVIVCDCSKEEIEEFVNAISDTMGTDYIVEVVSKKATLLSNFKRYLRYFIVPFGLFRKRKKYALIYGWQQFYALIYCWWCKLFHVKKRNVVIAVNFTYKEKKGIKGKIYKHFMKKIVQSKYLDYVHVLSFNYKKALVEELKIESKKIIVTPFGLPDTYSKYLNSPSPLNGEYYLAIGRSNRDYNWLVSEWESIEQQLVIISNTFKPKQKLPNNIIHENNVVGEAQFPYLINAKGIIIPIEDGQICSGDTVLLTAMSYEKKVIITYPSTLSEMYIKDKENGFYVSKNSGELKKLIAEIDKYPNVGKQARLSFLNEFSRYRMGQRINEQLKQEDIQ